MAINDSTIQATVERLMYLAATKLPKNARAALADAYKKEETLIAKSQLETIMENIKISDEKGKPICQDTGVPLICVDLGTQVQLQNDPYAAMKEAIKVSTASVPLRQNVINPFTKKNSGTNTERGIPAVKWNIVPKCDYMDITVIPKGFGAECRAAQNWILSSEDIGKATMRTVMDVVKNSLGEPCPPVIIGVGVGGFADTSMEMAKKALFRDPIGSSHPESYVASMENDLLESINSLNLGPMGLGGKTYALGVHIEYSGMHTAIAPVSVLFQCWAHRYSKARIYKDGQVEYLTHSEEGALSE